ncbi:RNA polymerase-binding protein RbpA [Pseudactinotalea terrae]|uniref:RNA polymerase-binding protein RbpA n=1 Tax=Pseudactinotalea terrae TaxID=1743262 RepID=UPI0012E18428|nr:RNA polymerase-binding protein RbpA [Pseudactinotalea terrae]
MSHTGTVLGATPWHQAKRSRLPAGEKALTRGPIGIRREAYVCPGKHRTELRFASTATSPLTWECPKCSQPAALEGACGTAVLPTERKLKDHIEQLYERRTPGELEALLGERLAALRAGALVGVDDFLGRAPHIYEA